MTTPTFVDFANKFANLKAELITELLTLLGEHTSMDLVRHFKDEDERVVLEGNTKDLPRKSYEDAMDCGRYRMCIPYKLERKFGVWCVRWNDSEDEYLDYYSRHETAEDYKDRPHFAWCDYEDLIKIYNRVYNIIKTPSLLDNEYEELKNSRNA